ncbi:TLR2 [Mytilus coruscus]|uniref:TLR2 n=1 Tax=Mytilus coruscus TaxID=42192 RepID=A0A6J8E7K2_MYTCO|nr:TLR2 [Mytilus coruscus]
MFVPPGIPTLCCGSALLAFGISLVIIACTRYAFYKNLPSDGYARDELKLRARKYNITENQLIEKELVFNIAPYGFAWVLSGLFIVSAFVWLICCSLHIFKKRKLMYRGLFIANHILIDHNLLVGFKHYKCTATVKMKARDLLIRMSVDFVQDFLEQKLENSESNRHTSRALKCCNHVYDFQSGRKIVENIKDAVHKSVKTLIILSKEYNDSHWCNFEVEYIHQMSMEMREQILKPVLKEDCEIPEHLKPFTYIDARGPIGNWLERLVAAIDSPSIYTKCSSEKLSSKI